MESDYKKKEEDRVHQEFRKIKEDSTSFRDTIETVDWFFDKTRNCIIKVVTQSHDDQYDPSNNWEKEISRETLTPEEVPEEVRKKLKNLLALSEKMLDQ